MSGSQQEVGLGFVPDQFPGKALPGGFRAQSEDVLFPWMVQSRQLAVATPALALLGRL